MASDGRADEAHLRLMRQLGNSLHLRRGNVACGGEEGSPFWAKGRGSNHPRQDWNIRAGRNYCLAMIIRLGGYLEGTDTALMRSCNRRRCRVPLSLSAVEAGGGSSLKALQAR